MAELYFANLLAHRPDVAAKATYDSLRPFHQYLTQAKKHLENSAPTLRWAPLGVAIRVRPSHGGIPGEHFSKEVDRRLRQSSLRVTSASGVTLEILSTHPDARTLVFDEAPPEGELTLRVSGMAPLGFAPERVEPGRLAEALDDDEGGVWIELQEPADDPGADRLVEAFLDEEVRTVSEVIRDEDGRLVRARGRHMSVLSRDAERQALCLERLPRSESIAIEPNTYVIECQLHAIESLQSRPRPGHAPLVRLFERTDHADWPGVEVEPVRKWYELVKDRPGTEEQRRFVERALGTPDFAFLEGPPGSGKTTAIVELILQLVRDGHRRVLLAASTHVAVDNVIERLKEKGKPGENLLVVRIGKDARVSEEVQPYCLERMVSTELSKLRDRLVTTRDRSRAQEHVLEALRSEEGRETVQRVVLDCAQVVCGTTIGILKHPDIEPKVRRHSSQPVEPVFDVLILDEASKTPFSEFLVPALLARRWIIVGDRRQLSPYVEEAWIETSVGTALPSEPLAREDLGRVLCDVFEVWRERRSSALIVASEDPEERAAYAAQIAAMFPGEPLVRLDGPAAPDPWLLGVARAVIGTPDQVAAVTGALPLATRLIRAPASALPELQRRHAALGSRSHDQETWAAAVAWRVVRDYELRLLPELIEDPDIAGVYAREVEALLPRDGAVQSPIRVRENLENVRRVALPSILESLQVGFDPGRGGRRTWDNALNRGLPPEHLDRRLLSLRSQHRMHPQISAFPRDRIYKRVALVDPPDMAEQRAFSLSRYGRARAIWLDVKGQEQARPICNPKEAEVVLTELGALAAWAATEPRDKPWSIAVLTFYRGQEQALRRKIREATRQFGKKRHFTFRQNGRDVLSVELCTVDRFQGHEADIVLLSFVRTVRPGFLNGPNRLNVALTRARYQLVLVGNHERLLREERRAPIVALLARDMKQQGAVELRY